MSLVRIDKVPNGEHWTGVEVYSCDECGAEINESLPHTSHEENIHYCWDCTFILGYVTSEKYLDLIGLGSSRVNADVIEGKVAIWLGKRAPWEKTPQDIRNSKEYAEWRKQVYERDSYTCQHCEQVGGQLNAHHIKPFAKYKELRFEVSNGLTLCVDCHRKEHRKGD